LGGLEGTHRDSGFLAWEDISPGAQRRKDLKGKDINSINQRRFLRGTLNIVQATMAYCQGETAVPIRSDHRNRPDTMKNIRRITWRKIKKVRPVNRLGEASHRTKRGSENELPGTNGDPGRKKVSERVSGEDWKAFLGENPGSGRAALKGPLASKINTGRSPC